LYNSLLLNGTSAYMTTPGNSFSLAAFGAWTVEGWVKTTSFGSQTILDHTGSNGGYTLSLSAGRAQFAISDSTGIVGSLTGSTQVANGAWHHVAGVWDGTNLGVYVDGVLDGQNQPASGPGWDYTPPAAVGATYTSGGNGGWASNLFNGKIDEVRVSNVALYTGSFSPSAHLTASSSTMGLWKFDLQTTHDASGNGNNGTLNGGATYSTDVPPNGIGSNLVRPDSGVYNAQNSQPRSGTRLTTVAGAALEVFANLSSGFMPGVGAVPLSFSTLIGGWFGGWFDPVPPMPTGGTWTIQWLVTDQLGTPRMIFDSTGSVSGMSRHDYLPFGEELAVNQGLRSASIGYAAIDNVRQHFAGSERDAETGLDFMQARYYANTQGRFTSADSLVGSIGDPQSLNRYAYVGNNPLMSSDPTGHTRFDASFGFGVGGSDQGGYMSPDDPGEDDYQDPKPQQPQQQEQPDQSKKRDVTLPKTPTGVSDPYLTARVTSTSAFNNQSTISGASGDPIKAPNGNNAAYGFEAKLEYTVNNVEEGIKVESSTETTTATINGVSDPNKKPGITTTVENGKFPDTIGTYSDKPIRGGDVIVVNQTISIKTSFVDDSGAKLSETNVVRQNRITIDTSARTIKIEDLTKYPKQ
jgi:RHS repeat-associated protein